MCELFAILKRVCSIVHIKDTKGGKGSSMFKVLLFVTGESSHISG